MMMTKKTFKLQILIEAMESLPENAPLLETLKTRIDEKSRLIQKDTTMLSNRIAQELLPAAIGPSDARYLLSKQNNVDRMMRYANENLTMIGEHLKRRKNKYPTNRDVDYKRASKNRLNQSTDEGVNLRRLSDRIAKDLLPAAIGKEKAKSILSKQTDHNYTVRYANDNLTEVIKHIETRQEHLLRRIENDYDRAIDAHEKRIQQTEDSLININNILREKEKNAEERIMRRLTGSRRSLLTRTASIGRVDLGQSYDDDVHLTRASSITNVYNINYNENSTTGGTFVWNQGQDDDST